nr:hypothetical protein [uncultured Cohaesibacter sp.]
MKMTAMGNATGDTMKKLTIICVCCFLAGCSGVNRAMQFDPKVHHVRVGDTAYRVFEHPKENVIMTTPPVAGAAARGFAKGLTLGLANTMPSEKVHEQAARDYLDQTGRSHCKITKGYLVVEPQYEFTYDCTTEPDEKQLIKTES